MDKLTFYVRHYRTIDDITAYIAQISLSMLVAFQVFRLDETEAYVVYKN